MFSQEVIYNYEYEYRSDIMQRIQRCFHTAIKAHCKVFMVRLDVRFPLGFVHDGRNTVVSELLRRLKANYTYHGVDCRYVWVREQNQSSLPHYHLLLLLDGSRIENGWGVRAIAGVLWCGLLDADCDACIHLCQPLHGGSGIMIRRPSSRSEGEKLHVEKANCEAAYRAAVDWSSYLAKTHTKGEAPHGVREWGSSRF